MNHVLSTRTPNTTTCTQHRRGHNKRPSPMVGNTPVLHIAAPFTTDLVTASRPPMAALAIESTKLFLVGLAALAISMVTLTFGAATANADPNDPSPTDVGRTGTVTSRQADSTSGARRCMVSSGTLNTTSRVTSDVGTPMQRTNEAGPSWVGSDGWHSRSQSSANPWARGSFNRNRRFNQSNAINRPATRTGPQCRQGTARRADTF